MFHSAHTNQSENTMTELNILTLNTWGVPNSKDKDIRAAALADYLSTCHHHIIALQEMWTPAAIDTVREGAIKGGLEHIHHFPSGIIGSGLMLLSRFPVEEIGFRRFRLAGAPEPLWQGDFLAGKGMAYARLKLPETYLDVYNTHVVAQYRPDEQDVHRPHRAAQIFELAQWVNRLSADVPVIVMGDFNSVPHQPGYRIMTVIAGMKDCFGTLHPGEDGYTFIASNPYGRAGHQERLDYVFVRDGGGLTLTPMTAEVTMQSTGQAHPPAYADHYGVEATLSMETGSSDAALSADVVLTALTDVKTMLSAAILETQARQLSHIQQFRFGIAVLWNLLPGRKTNIVRLLAFILTLLFVLGSGLYGRFLVPTETTAFQSITNEIEVLMRKLSHQEED